MSAKSIWDDPSLRPQSGQYMKFTSPGDKVEGTVATLGKHTFPDGKSALQITFAEEDVPTLTAGQVVLNSGLFEVRPAVGEKLYVEFTKVEAKGTKTLKHFYIRATGEDGSVRTAGDGPSF